MSTITTTWLPVLLSSPNLLLTNSSDEYHEFIKHLLTHLEAISNAAEIHNFMKTTPAGWGIDLPASNICVYLTNHKDRQVPVYG